MAKSPAPSPAPWIEPTGSASGFARLDGEAFPDFVPGTVWLVGAGPGAPGLMSLLCYHAMQSCDVVVYDALVNPDILRWVRVGAELEYAGKRGGKPSPKQRDITLRLIELAAQGKRVLYVEDFLQGLAFKPIYMSDAVHPNTEGYRRFAERLEGILLPHLDTLRAATTPR